MGIDSCYAKKEGIYVRRIARTGIDTIAEAKALAYLVLRDYRRGWTYDKYDCRKIPMSHDLFKKRLQGILSYAGKHTDDLVEKGLLSKSAREELLKRIKEIIDYVESYKRIPSEWEKTIDRLIAEVKKRKSKKKKKRKKRVKTVKPRKPRGRVKKRRKRKRK